MAVRKLTKEQKDIADDFGISLAQMRKMINAGYSDEWIETWYNVFGKPMYGIKYTRYDKATRMIVFIKTKSDAKKVMQIIDDMRTESDWEDWDLLTRDLVLGIYDYYEQSGSEEDIDIYSFVISKGKGQWGKVFIYVPQQNLFEGGYWG